MKLSTRSRYGLIAIVDLAVEYGKGPISLSRLAQSQGVSEAYLEQLLRSLKNNGIIEASRGISGGYSLKIQPEKISAGQIIEILEGHTSLVDCVSTDNNPGCDRACLCAARPLFLNLQNKIDDVLNHTKISDLTKDYIEQKKRLEKMKVYLDNAATTKVRDEVVKEMLPYFTEYYGNPSSLHSFARDAALGMDKARQQLADALGAKTTEIIFTGGGSESDNMVIRGITKAYRKKGNHIITTAIEHHAILHTLKELEDTGEIEVTYLPVDENGLVTAQQVKDAIKSNTILVTVMFANNEVGTVMPISEIGKICRENNVLFHTDAVQAVGHLPINVVDMNIDMLSLSAHKFHGPKGVGALYVRTGIRIPALITGGAQERKKRAGTENVPGIIGMGKAVELATAELNNNIEYISKLRDKLIAGVEKNTPYVKLNGHRSKRLPNNVNFSIRFIEGESILLMLDLNGIAASSGSACTSGSLDPSHVLLAMGLDHETAHGSLRMTLSEFTTEEEIDYVIEVLPTIVKKLRAMSPLYKEEK